MPLAPRTILCAGLLALLLVPLALAQDESEMYIYSDLYQAGFIVYAYGYTQLAHPDQWAQCPANQDDCWDYYPSYTSLYLTKDGGWQAFEQDQEYDSYSEVWATADADAGTWALEAIHSISVDWEDWYYNLHFTSRSDSLYQPEYAYMTIYPPGCGYQQKDALIAEYPAYGVAWTPSCADVTPPVGSAHFSASEINQDNDYGASWTITRQNLLTGLENIRTAAGNLPMPLSSGYRNPASQMRINPGAMNSRHVYGDAADVTETNTARRELFKWTLGPQYGACVEDLNKTPTWVHFDWRGLSTCPADGQW